MSKFLGVSLLSFASKKGRTWEHGAGTPCKLLSSHSFSERLERSEKAFRKRRFISKFLRVFLFSVSEAKRNVPGNTRHVPPKTPFLKLLFRTPDKICTFFFFFTARLCRGGHAKILSRSLIWAVCCMSKTLPCNAIRTSWIILRHMSLNVWRTNSRNDDIISLN